MITLDDIEDMTCLTRDQITAVADHEHLAELSAALMAEYLMQQHNGPQAVQQMICEDIQAALHESEIDRARALFGTLRQFVLDHPEAVRGASG